MNYRVLIIDDNKITLEIAQKSLSSFGFQVEICSHWAQMSKLLPSFRPDLILLDVNLDSFGFDGDKICKNLRDLYPDIKIVYYSSLSEEELMELSDKTNANGFLTKGTRMSDLVLKIKRIIER